MNRIPQALLFFAAAFTLSHSIGAETPGGKGTCYYWSDDLAPRVFSCEAATEVECAKGKQPLLNKDTYFGKFTGKLYGSPGASMVYEFRDEPIAACEKAMIKGAREAEASMSAGSRTAVYSIGLKVGDRAVVYGSSVILREKPSVKANKVAVLTDRAPVEVVAISKEMDAVPGLYKAYWFEVKVEGKKGWVYGQFIHPDPNSPELFIPANGCHRGFGLPG